MKVSSVWLWTTAIVVVVDAGPTSRKIQILNEGRGLIELFWIHPVTHELSLMSNPDIMPGADFSLDSYVTHQFRVKEKKCNKLPNGQCRTCEFAVSENDDQIIHVTEDVECELVDNKVKARKEAQHLISECQAAALESNSSIEQAMNDLAECVQRGVARRLEEIQEEIAFQSTVRKEIAANLENYTCADSTLDSTPDVSEQVWIHDRDSRVRRRKVHVKLNRPSSRIHVIENFIDSEECDAMEEAAKKLLHRATVADGRGGSRLSESRKAMQAGIKVPWDKEKDGNPIARLSRRVYDYTNDVLGLALEEHGQEDLMSIQYFGRGINDTEPDRYTPHCDGDCTGLEHKSGTRMATMVMYCSVATRGGHTNFRNAGVHVKPQVGNAIFFSYIDPETRIMDTGFTEHSGCPVYEGQKKIVTQWIRWGVDEENPWDSFNTLGISYKDIQEMDADEVDEQDEEIDHTEQEEDDEETDGSEDEF